MYPRLGDSASGEESELDGHAVGVLALEAGVGARDSLSYGSEGGVLKTGGLGLGDMRCPSSAWTNLRHEPLEAMIVSMVTVGVEATLRCRKALARSSFADAECCGVNSPTSACETVCSVASIVRRREALSGSVVGVWLIGGSPPSDPTNLDICRKSRAGYTIARSKESSSGMIRPPVVIVSSRITRVSTGGGFPQWSYAFMPKIRALCVSPSIPSTATGTSGGRSCAVCSCGFTTVACFSNLGTVGGGVCGAVSSAIVMAILCGSYDEGFSGGDGGVSARCGASGGTWVSTHPSGSVVSQPIPVFSGGSSGLTLENTVLQGGSGSRTSQSDESEIDVDQCRKKKTQ